MDYYLHTITAGDGKTSTKFHVYIWQDKFDFENWFVENPSNDQSMHYSAPITGWSSSNPGVFMIRMLYKLTDKYVVTQSDDAASGKSAARIETIDTKGKKGLPPIIPHIPKITTGTLFLGKFETDIKNTLNSTKFGMPYYKKPLRVTGQYKYIPGKEFYRATGMSDCHEAKLENGTEDECAINAVLYEIESDGDDFLTGDGTYDIENEKLVAIAKLEDGTRKDSYTQFDIKFDFVRSYDPNKKYRLAVICSSSKWGDIFSGSPGSVLYVDDIEIISE